LLHSCSTVFDGGALVIREWNTGEHSLEVVPRLHELGFGRVLRQVEVAPGTGHAVRALLEEAVRAVAMTKIGNIAAAPLPCNDVPADTEVVRGVLTGVPRSSFVDDLRSRSNGV
jgi:hypothetical protein